MRSIKAPLLLGLAIIGCSAGISLAALLGVLPGFPLLTYDSTGTVAYTAVTDEFNLNASPIAIRFSAVTPPRFINPTGFPPSEVLRIRVLVDSNGALTSGVPGDDLVIEGEVDADGNGSIDYSGILLTGEALGFGFLETGATDQYDFRFVPTGGSLISFFNGKDIGLVVSSENSTFNNSFEVAFLGGAKGQTGPIDKGPQCVVDPELEAFCSGTTTSIMLDGSLSSDPEGDPLTYNWTTNCPGGVFDDSHSATPILTIDTAPGCEVNCTATLVVSDGRSNSEACTESIHISDTEAPEIDCPPDATVQCTDPTDPGQTGSATASDACDPAPVVTYSDGVAAGTCPQAYVITRTWTATDNCGLSTNCTQTITVRDNAAPTVSCPASLTVPCGSSTDPTDTGTATASDNCDLNPTVSYSDSASGSCPQIITRIWSASDACGNSSEPCTQTITVTDTTKPTVTCPANTTVQCGSSTAPSATGTATGSDNCDPNPVVSYSDSTSGACPQTITRVWKATDACNNVSDPCTQTITVTDTTKPTVTCPANTTVQCGSSTAPSATGTATGSDNCDPNPVVSYSDSTSGTCPKTITRVWKATDACNNVSDPCTQTITVADTTKPTVTCPANTTVQCGSSTAPSATGTATGSDNCDPNPVVSYSDSTSGTCPKIISRVWKATDSCNNVSDPCTQTITVTDTTKPTVTCPANKTLTCGSSTAPSATGTATGSDNCDPAPVVSYSDSVSGGCPKVISRVWKATDNCGNVSTPCTQTITLTDTVDPVICCPANKTIQCGGSTAPSATGTATATDNCDPNPVITYSDSISGTCPKTITRTWKATDSCGRYATCCQTICLTDTTAPTITCPPTFTVPCNGSKLPATTGTATGSDACSTVTISYSDGASTSVGCGTSKFTRTWKAKDACNNQCTCDQTIYWGCPTGQICGKKFFDTNANGCKDTSESYISNWKITLTGPTGTAVKYTDSGGSYSFTGLPAGTYTVTETLPANWQNTTPLSASATISSTCCSVTVDFGNYCYNPPANGYNCSWWTGSSGQSCLSGQDNGNNSSNWRVLLNGLNLKNANGTAFTLPTAKNGSGVFTTNFATAYASFKTWMNGASSTNMAYRLSTNLAATSLSVAYKSLVDNTVIVVPGGVKSRGASPSTPTCIVGYCSVTQSITGGSPALLTLTSVSGSNSCGCTAKNATVKIADLRTRAKTLLGAYNNTTGAGTARTYEECVSDLLDMINHNGNQPAPNGCPCGPVAHYMCSTICPH